MSGGPSLSMVLAFKASAHVPGSSKKARAAMLTAHSHRSKK